MIRNILYSLFLHSILIIFVYFSFNFTKPQESEKTSKVTMNFVVRTGNTENSINQAPPKQENSQPQKIEKPKEIKPEPKPAAKKPIKKPEKAKQKPKPKKEKKPAPKKSTPKPEEKKPDLNLKKEPQKIPEPKEEEKKPEIKEEPKKEDKAKEEEKLDEEEDEVEEEQLPENQTPQYSFDAKKLDSLDLLAREKFNIHNQISVCYKKALQESGGKSNVVINTHIIIDDDGYINPKSIVIKDSYKYDDPQEAEFRKSADIVKRAIQFCSPLRNLPEDKYEIWRELDLEFDSSN